MATKIQWTQETFNPIVGCSKVSPGCDNCYAERQAYRNLLCLGAVSGNATDTYEAYEAAVAYDVANYPNDMRPAKSLGWSGWTYLIESALRKPLKRKKPTMYFVCSMSDLFHEDTPFGWIDQVFAVMALCPQHTFQILTKRPMRMLEYFSDDSLYARRVYAAIQRLPGHEKSYTHSRLNFPLRNVWLGVTAENQEYADQRIPILLKCPAAVRFVSVEPMLGPIEIPGFLPQSYANHTCHQGGLDWVICGCESGPRRRWMNPNWAEYLMKQCRDAGVPFFMKQYCTHRGRVVKKLEEIPEYLRIREWPEVQA